jgi:hypothetical protein
VTCEALWTSERLKISRMETPISHLSRARTSNELISFLTSGLFYFQLGIARSYLLDIFFDRTTSWLMTYSESLRIWVQYQYGLVLSSLLSRMRFVEKIHNSDHLLRIISDQKSDLSVTLLSQSSLTFFEDCCEAKLRFLTANLAVTSPRVRVL